MTDLRIWKFNLKKPHFENSENPENSANLKQLLKFNIKSGTLLIWPYPRQQLWNYKKNNLKKRITNQKR